MADAVERPCIYVIAGPNGAGKSSVIGAAIRELSGEYFNPDEIAQRMTAADRDVRGADANAAAWNEGRRLLERAIADRSTFALETTLGGHTILALLRRAIDRGFDVRTWYIGLGSPEQHIARVRARVARGGHDIPDAKIRERFNLGRQHLIRILPELAELRLFDNSVDADPADGLMPAPVLLLHVERGAVAGQCELQNVPEWAKPIVAAALKRSMPRRSKKHG